MIHPHHFVTLTRFYRMWHAQTAALRAVETDTKRRIRDLIWRLDHLDERTSHVALQFDSIHQAVGTLQGDVTTLLGIVHDVQNQNTTLSAQVTDLLGRVAAGTTSPEDAQAEWADAQAELDATGASIDDLDTHVREAIDGAKASLPPQAPAPVTPAGNGGIPDASTQPVAPAGAVISPDVTGDPVPTPGNTITGLGGVSVDGQPGAPVASDGTVTTPIASTLDPAAPVADPQVPANDPDAPSATPESPAAVPADPDATVVPAAPVVDTAPADEAPATPGPSDVAAPTSSVVTSTPSI